MATIVINTTQNVNINFESASLGERILSYGIDLMIKVAYFFATAYLFIGILDLKAHMKGWDSWSKMAVYIIIFSPVIFYTLVFELLLNGQTIGKRIMEIKVVKIDGYQASLADYLARWMFRIVDVNMVSGLVAIISISASSKNQRLGGITSGTTVISVKNKVNINQTILENLSEDYVPTYTNVIRLSDNDARIIKDAFIKAKRNKDFETLTKLRKKLVEVLELKSIGDGQDVTFINTVLKDYNYYTQDM